MKQEVVGGEVSTDLGCPIGFSRQSEYVGISLLVNTTKAFEAYSSVVETKSKVWSCCVRCAQDWNRGERCGDYGAEKELLHSPPLGLLPYSFSILHHLGLERSECNRRCAKRYVELGKTSDVSGRTFPAVVKPPSCCSSSWH